MNPPLSGPCVTCLHRDEPVTMETACGKCRVEEDGRHTYWKYGEPDQHDITNAVAAPSAIGTSRQARPGFFLAVARLVARLVKGDHPWN